jgi:predicted phosphohydrolase
MTQIQIASDLHIEFKNDEIPDPLNYITPSAEILILAGDIGSLYKIDQLKGFLELLCPHFKNVIYIPGNHEYYTVQNYDHLSMNKLLNRLYEIEKYIKNLYILNQSSIVIGDICITGCTLWSRPKVTIPKFIVRIYGMNTEIYEKKFSNDVNYINKMIDHCNKNNLKLVVATHYCPTYDVIDEEKNKDIYVSLYASELDHLLHKEKVHTWICGHIHRNFDINSKNGTRVVGNQLGKPRDKITDYLKDCVIEI